MILNPFLQAKTADKPLTADYVIIGVGTAGALMAKELSDDHKTTVIALHNGENLTQDPLIKFSENAALTVAAGLVKSPLYENGETVPQKYADNRELLWALALPEGGASAINAGAYCRGTNEVYKQWEEIAGPNWSLHRILEIYKDLEHYRGESANCHTRGCHGPISVLQVQDPSCISLKFTQATIEATRYPFVIDYNDPHTPVGVSSQFQYTRSGPQGDLRVSSATAFLNKDVMTPNGHGVQGRKLLVLFDSNALRTFWEGNKAVGVEYLQDGQHKQVFAKKGVIVCAGLKSSFFLMHSGVGPASLLHSLGIPIVYDNPNVGQGLADQPQVPILFTANPLDSQLDTNDFFVQISWLPAPNGDSRKREVRLAVLNPLPGVAPVLVDLCQPKSRGSITIKSADPLVPPVIDLREFSDPSDLLLYHSVFKHYIKRIHFALREIDPLYQLIVPPPDIIDDDALLLTFIKESVASNQCFQSHCRMARLEQGGGVVDNTGRVHGVENLIVADDSIVPFAMDGTPMASAYLIAANIARLLVSER